MSLSTLRMRLPADADLSVKIKEIVVPRKLSFLTDLVVCSSSLLVVGSFLWFPLALYFVLKRCKTRRARLIVLAVVVVLVLVPVKQWPAVRRTRFWDAWTRYFSPTIIVDGDKELPSDRSLLYCFMPHGIYPFGQVRCLACFNAPNLLTCCCAIATGHLAGVQAERVLP